MLVALDLILAASITQQPSLRFEPNLGQAPAAVSFLARGERSLLTLDAQGWTLILSDGVLRTRLRGAHLSPVGDARLPGVVNDYRSTDPARWVENLPTYASVRCPEAWPGVELVLHASPDGRFEYDFILAPGADPAAIVLEITGAPLSLDAVGALHCALSQGEIIQPAPVIYQDAPGGRHFVSGGFTLSGSNLGFQVGPHNPELPLIIDPTLEFGTYLGGLATEWMRGLAVDASGAIYVTGFTHSVDFPSVNALQANLADSQDAFISKFAADGRTLLYSTFLGGPDGRPLTDEAWAITVDSHGAAYVVGSGGLGFPTTSGAWHDTVVGGGFAAKLSPAGGQLEYCTKIPGASIVGLACAVDGAGALFVCGEAGATLPVTSGAFDESFNGFVDGFVLKLNPAGSDAEYCTFLGGVDVDQPFGIVLEPNGAAWLTGRTVSPDFPFTANAWDSTMSGFSDAWLARLSADGKRLDYSSFLGGTGTEAAFELARDPAGNLYVTGWTGSPDFPVTPGAFQTGYLAGYSDGFVTKFAPSGGAPVWSTYLGGGGMDTIEPLAVDVDGGVWVGVRTGSTDYPLTARALDDSYNGSEDAALTKIAADGGSLEYSSFHGGTGLDWPTGLAALPGGAVVLGGITRSTDLPTTSSAFDESPNGADECFITRFLIGDGDFPLVVSDLHLGTPASVTAAEVPPGAFVQFALTRRGIGAGPCPASLGGLCLDLLPPVVLLGGTAANSSGVATLFFNIPSQAPTGSVWLQAVIRSGAGGATSSKSDLALGTLQP